MRYTLLTVVTLVMCFCCFDASGAKPPGDWIELFDGRTLDGWKASENADTWRVEDGCLVAKGPRSHLFYTGPVGKSGPVGKHDFRNFELETELRTEPGANSGVYFHTEYQEAGWPKKGYEIQVNNSYTGSGNYRELKQTGSLYGVRNIHKSCAADNEWFRIRVSVVGKRIRVWVNDVPTVDYLEADRLYRKENFAGRLLSSGTVALQGHDPGSQVSYRTVKIRLLPDGLKPDAANPKCGSDFGLKPGLMDRLAGLNIPVIDYHVHLRGGMTVEKAVQRQAATGINCGVLKNIGRGWPIETDEQLGQFIESVQGKPLFVGLQVNDRDWMTAFSPKLLARLDFVLGDTMIMPMPDDDSPPVKLWKTDRYTIENPEAWMERYVRHNLRVLSEPITILANPTYLPPPVEKMYDKLWTDQRMRQIIRAAIENNVALEINGKSGLPSERFIRMAKQMGAKFTFGSNNFHDKPTDMTRCFDAVDRHGLRSKDILVPMVPKSTRGLAERAR